MYMRKSFSPSAPLAALLMEKTSARTTAFIGCFGSGIALATASIVNNFEVLYVTYGALTG